MRDCHLPFYGSAAALATPFSNGDVDYAALERLIDFHLNNHTDAIVVCGTSGESSALSEDERSEIVRFTVSKVKNRIPVIVGTGSNVTEHAVRLSRAAEANGADALLLVTPYYNKTSQRGLVLHYETIAASTSLPCILYNVPSRTGMTISIDAYCELSRVENIVATKEASGDLHLAGEIIHRCGDNLQIYSGEDSINIDLMRLGAKGCISVLADVVPEQSHAMMQLCLSGKYDEAREMHNQYLPLIKMLFMEVNPIPLKHTMQLMGLCSDELRMPLCKMEEDKVRLLFECLTNYGLLP